MTASEVLREFRAIGGRLIPAGEKLRWQSPVEPPPQLIEELRQRKTDLLVLLRSLELPCIACGGMYAWRDSAGAEHCGRCEPDPRAHRLRGVTLETLGSRPITLQPPTGDLPMPGYWYRTPAGAVGELVLYEAAGAEVLLRELSTGRLAWHRPETLVGEMDWGWTGGTPCT